MFQLSRAFAATHNVSFPMFVKRIFKTNFAECLLGFGVAEGLTKNPKVITYQLLIVPLIYPNFLTGIIWVSRC